MEEPSQEYHDGFSHGLDEAERRLLPERDALIAVARAAKEFIESKAALETVNKRLILCDALEALPDSDQFITETRLRLEIEAEVEALLGVARAAKELEFDCLHYTVMTNPTPRKHTVDKLGNALAALPDSLKAEIEKR